MFYSFVVMELTASQKRVKDRIALVATSFNTKGETSISAMVKNLAGKIGVSELTIYNDLKKLGLTKRT
jgi:DeoR/GlpR family transcriptional regulator of sugar metabolism